jgi:hypothetical protein
MIERRDHFCTDSTQILLVLSLTLISLGIEPNITTTNHTVKDGLAVCLAGGAWVMPLVRRLESKHVPWRWALECQSALQAGLAI